MGKYKHSEYCSITCVYMAWGSTNGRNCMHCDKYDEDLFYEVELGEYRRLDVCRTKGRPDSLPKK